MKKSRIYTRQGDSGCTSLANGKRVSKSSIRIEAYGTIDELNSQIGLLAAITTNTDEAAFLIGIQRRLFTIGGILATEESESKALNCMKPDYIDEIEERIDLNDAQLPPLKAFILPGGCMAAAVAHVCRTVCRRAERQIVALSKVAPVDKILQCYINRLSDYLFVLARKLNFTEKAEEKNL
mgnify:FL=1